MRVNPALHYHSITRLDFMTYGISFNPSIFKLQRWCSCSWMRSKLRRNKDASCIIDFRCKIWNENSDIYIYIYIYIYMGGGGDQEGLLVIKFPSGFEVRNDRLYFSNNSNCAMLAYNLPSTLYKIISKRWGWVKSRRTFIYNDYSDQLVVNEQSLLELCVPLLKMLFKNHHYEF